MEPRHYTESEHKRALDRLLADMMRREEGNEALVEAHLNYGWRLIEPPDEDK